MRCAFWGMFALTGVCSSDGGLGETWAVQWLLLGLGRDRTVPGSSHSSLSLLEKFPFQHEEKLRTRCRMARKCWLQQGICGCQRRALGERFSLGKAGSGDNPGLQTCPPHFARAWHAEQPLANSWAHWEAAWRLADLSRLPYLSLCYIPSSPWPLARGLWAALVFKPPGGLSCHPHSAMVPTSSCVHQVWHTPHGGLQTGAF